MAAAIFDTTASRRRMIEQQMVARGISDPRVLRALDDVHREWFLPPDLVHAAYDDRPLPVGFGQTISQPYIVACMTEMLRLERAHKTLEIGTGSGYQTAILARIASQVYTVERIAALADEARSRLTANGFDNVHYRVGDGSLGWPEAAPFDRILVTAAAPASPTSLLAQLADRGRMVIPLGDVGTQTLTVFERHGATLVERPNIGVRFVPLIGAEGFAE